MKVETRRNYDSALIEFKELTQLRGWKRLVEIAKAQQEVRKNAVILTPMGKLDNALEQEFMKGEYAGIGMLLLIPEIEISKYEELIKANEEEKETENED